MASQATSVPTHPSNRSFIDQLRAWDVEIEEGGEKWRAKMPNGTKLVVFAPTFHDGNPSGVFAEAYRALGVTPEMFWSGPATPERPLAAVPEAPKPSRKQYINRVLDCLVQFGAPMSIQKIGEELGLTPGQVSSAARQLVQQDVIVAMKQGVYVAKQYAADYRVEVAVTAPEPTKPEPAKERPKLVDVAPEPAKPAEYLPPPAVEHEPDEPDDLAVDELMEIVLDLLFPAGMHIRGADLRTITDWIASTKSLLERVRSAE